MPEICKAYTVNKLKMPQPPEQIDQKQKL